MFLYEQLSGEDSLGLGRWIGLGMGTYAYFLSQLSNPPALGMLPQSLGVSMCQTSCV